MDYIVLDMEWNQPWPGSPSARKVLPVQIRGEIIQIGAVRITPAQKVADEFQVMIQPKYYRRLNRRVSKLTGIRESQLREEGVSMEEAMSALRRWCGEDPVFLCKSGIMLLTEKAFDKLLRTLPAGGCSKHDLNSDLAGRISFHHKTSDLKK